jgi:hypothetical protein
MRPLGRISITFYIAQFLLFAALRSGTGYHARRSTYAEMRTAEIKLSGLKARTRVSELKNCGIRRDVRVFPLRNFCRARKVMDP